MFATLVLACVFSADLSPDSAADVALVCPAAFLPAMQPWIEHRQAQGRRIAVVSNLGSAETIRKRIVELSEGGALRYVVLVGDADPKLESDRALREVSVPLHYAKAEVNVLWGSEPYLSTDLPYGDFDGDGAPEAAVGRLPADSVEELRAMVRKTLAYERSADFGPWRRQVDMVAGVGGFGPMADAIIESTARYFLTQNVPADYNVAMTYGSWQSPFCPDPRQFRETALERLNEGALCWIYAGHGQPGALDLMRTPQGTYPILAAADAPKLKCRRGAPIALFLACYVGAVDASPDCLAEALLKQPGGPVAVLAGSRVTMPYAMTLLACGLSDQLFTDRGETLGDAVLAAKRAMLAQRSDDPRRAMLDALAKAVSPAPKLLAAERAEHVRMFNLLGDPLLKLHHPKGVELAVPASAVAGARLPIRGKCEVEGKATIELVVARGRLTFPCPPRREYPGDDASLSAFQEVYRRANDPRLASLETPSAGGRFAAELQVPPDARGECHIRVFIEGKDAFAQGAAPVQVTSP